MSRAANPSAEAAALCLGAQAAAMTVTARQTANASAMIQFLFVFVIISSFFRGRAPPALPARPAGHAPFDEPFAPIDEREPRFLGGFGKFFKIFFCAPKKAFGKPRIRPLRPPLPAAAPPKSLGRPFLLCLPLFSRNAEKKHLPDGKRFLLL